MMKLRLTTRRAAAGASLFALFMIASATAGAADPAKIDLRTRKGADAVKAEWRWHDVTLVPVVGKNQDGSPNKTYNYEPRAMGLDYDDSKWEVIAPETLKNPRSTGLICFCWYRVKVTLPAEAEGKRVFFQTVVDDYGEVWVDGELPYKPGDVGGPIAAGFNAPNRVELKDARPGRTYQLAVFGINGPISVTPTNRIFLGPTFLELIDKK
jgi:gluconolactonase